MTIVIISVAVIAVAMLVMAVGVILKGKCLSGSCGGPKVVGPNGQIQCGACGRNGQESEHEDGQGQKVGAGAS